MRKKYQKFLRLQIIPQFFAEFFAIVNFTVKFYGFFSTYIFFQIFKQKITKKIIFFKNFAQIIADVYTSENISANICVRNAKKISKFFQQQILSYFFAVF